MEKKKTYNVAVVGATGAVGQEMIRMLETRRFPVEKLTALASGRSAGKQLKFNNSSIEVKKLDNQSLSGVDIAIFSAGATISKEFAPLFAKNGTYVIDNSSAWRMDPAIPLVVPEVNPQALSPDKKIIANPNCSTIQMLVALKPINDLSPLTSIRVSTYQAVSGAGGQAMQELEDQSKAFLDKKDIPAPAKIKKQIAFNVVPHIDVFQENGYTKEEMKMVNETRKILGIPDLPVSATCVRVPVFRSHSEAVWVETRDTLDVDRVRETLSRSAGLVVVDDPSQLQYPMPIDAEGESKTFVGRLRKDIASKNGLLFWVVSDNLLKGAALNAVEIAELLIAKKIV